jgi:deazaflavin-dependent oxidoreductase (nitroreductase family)
MISVVANKPGPALRVLFRVPVLLYRWRLGWLLGHRFLLLAHVGRRSGARHETVLEVVSYETTGPAAIVMSGWGRGADWYRNVLASPSSDVFIGRQHWTATWEVLDEQDAFDVFTEYERRNRWMAPIVRRVLSSLVGWAYDGSTVSRRRLVSQLPLVRFRPS